MAATLREYLEQHPVDRDAVEQEKQRLRREIAAYRLRELREEAGLTQAQLAERIGVGQRQVSKIEHGDLENTRVGTIRKYLRAVGGDISLDWVIGEQRAALL
ncbi:MAG: helix-turn-helix domain-containing protein [Galactobacter sp.]|uniref:helix-turn-helix domain-containing protein n=1 Tax=Galactobacter sp. TaxID=2676125 RepID=UPI0025C1D60C|nr:helix-turn-helix transcriptional regulator [Galactobacter sp.]